MSYKINPELFERTLTACFEMARTEIEEQPLGQLAPKLMLAVQDEEDGGWQFHLAVFEEFGQDRYQMVKALGIDFGLKQKQVVAAYLMTEGWISIQTLEEREAHVENRIPPSEDPDRKEGLIVVGMTLDGHVVTISAKIDRDRQGQAILGEPERPQKAESPLLLTFFRGYAGAFLLRRNVKI
jgi:hypothetical protein